MIKNGLKTVRWKKTQLIGKGSFGNVYMAFEESLGIPITIKQIPILGLVDSVK